MKTVLHTAFIGCGKEHYYGSIGNRRSRIYRLSHLRGVLNAGEDIIVIDNFYNSKPKAIEAIKEITGRDFRFYENDCCDREALDRISERTSSQK